MAPGPLADRPRPDLGEGVPPAPAYALGDPALGAGGGGVDPRRVRGALPPAGAAAVAGPARLGGRADAPGDRPAAAAGGAATAGIGEAVASRDLDDPLSRAPPPAPRRPVARLGAGAGA